MVADEDRTIFASSALKERSYPISFCIARKAAVRWFICKVYWDPLSFLHAVLTPSGGIEGPADLFLFDAFGNDKLGRILLN